MTFISQIFTNLLLEQDSKLTTLSKSITDRIPVTIDYHGPEDEVLSGQRIDIEPIVLGKNIKSGNLVIWAYVFSGVSKKGLPGWKMFRVDRISSVSFNENREKFDLESLPDYEKGKAPNAMKSLSSVDAYSPYWFGDETPAPSQTQYAGSKPKITIIPKNKENVAQNEPQYSSEVPNNEPQQTSPEPQPEPNTENTPSSSEFSSDTLSDLSSKIIDTDGQKTINQNDYNLSLNDLYYKKEGEWRSYQRQISGNLRPGEGTRQRFRDESKTELDNLLSTNNITVLNQMTPLNESRKRIIDLIKWCF
jgi:MoaA/NifB/PqqE/SkfB family radical SAM enzyme